MTSNNKGRKASDHGSSSSFVVVRWNYNGDLSSVTTVVQSNIVPVPNVHSALYCSV